MAHASQSDEDWHRDRAVVVAHSHNLILALRTNSLFSSRQRFVEAGKEGSHKLMTYVKHLRRDLLSHNQPLPPPRLLQPFIEVSKSEETTGPITGVALSALATFLELRLVFVDVPTIIMISTAALEVKTEVADAQSHEAVLGRILQVLKACVCHPKGVNLPEEVMLKILQGCFAIAMHGYPSELLRHTADATTTDMVSHIYQNVLNGTAPHCFPKVFKFIVSMINTEADTLGKVLGSSATSYAESDNGSVPSKTQVAATKFAGLSLVYVVIATLKETITQPQCAPLLMTVQDELCRSLLSVSSTVDNVVVIAQMLRTLQLTAMACGDHIAPQLLAFLLGTYLKEDTPPDHDTAERKEVVLESLMEFCSLESFPVFLVETYDCDLHSPGVFEALCKHLTSQCYPSTAADGSVKLTSLNLCACNTLLQLIKSLGGRCLGVPPVEPSTQQRELMVKKQHLSHFAKLFAEKPKNGVNYARNLPLDPETGRNIFGLHPESNGIEVGTMLFEFRAVLHKRLLGEYISEGGLDPDYSMHKRDSETEEDFAARIAQDADRTHGRVLYSQLVREGFYSSFAFKGMTLTTAMRMVLSAYLLPGEAQRIDRLMEEFATRWHAENVAPDGSRDESINPFANSDAAFVFAFSLIMLNTDLHSNQVEKKMTLLEFRRNNRGTNAGKDVCHDYQEMVFNDIRSSKIKMQDAVVDIASEDYQWAEAVKKSRETGGRVGPISAATVRDFDSYLFGVLVNPAISALSAVTEAVDESTRRQAHSHHSHGGDKQTLGGEVIISDTMQGLYNCGALAAHFGMTGVADKLVIALCKFTEVFQPSYGPSAITRLGRSSKGLQAIRTLFRVISDFGDYVRDSWLDALDLVMRIYLQGCLPEQQQQQQPPAQGFAHASSPERAQAGPERANSFPNYSAGNAGPQAIPSVPSTASLSSTGGAASPRVAGGGDGGFPKAGPPNQASSFYECPVSPIIAIKPLDRAGAAADEEERPVNSWSLFGSNEEVKRQQQAQTRAALSRVCGVISECSIGELIQSRMREFSDPVLFCIIIALIKLSGVELPQVEDGNEHFATAKPSSIHATVFSVHVLADLLVSNGHRFEVAVQPIEAFYTRLLLTATKYICSKQRKQETAYWISVGEHVVVSKLRVFVRLATAADRTLARTEMLLRTLATFDNLHQNVFGPLVSRHVSTALSFVLQTSALDDVRSAAAWEMLITLTYKSGLLAKSTNSTVVCLDVLQHMVANNSFQWPDNVPRLVEALVHLYLLLSTSQDDLDWEHVTRPEGMVPVHTVAQQQQLGSAGNMKVIGCLTQVRDTLMASVGDFSAPTHAWVVAWLHLLTGYANIVAANTVPRGPNANPDSIPRERSDALIALQRSLLAPEIAKLPIPVCYEAMTKVLVPLVQRLCEGTPDPRAVEAAGFFGRFSPTLAINSVFGLQQAEPPAAKDAARPASSAAVKQALSGVEDLQTRVLALLCRAFLHFVGNARLASHAEEFMALWKQLLGLLYAYHSRPPQSGRIDSSETVKEAVREQTKNLVNVLASLACPDLAEIPNFWVVTRHLIAPFKELAGPLNAHLDSLGLQGGVPPQ